MILLIGMKRDNLGNSLRNIKIGQKKRKAPCPEPLPTSIDIVSSTKLRRLRLFGMIGESDMASPISHMFALSIPEISNQRGRNSQWTTQTQPAIIKGLTIGRVSNIDKLAKREQQNLLAGQRLGGGLICFESRWSASPWKTHIASCKHQCCSWFIHENQREMCMYY